MRFDDTYVNIRKILEDEFHVSSVVQVCFYVGGNLAKDSRHTWSLSGANS